MQLRDGVCRMSALEYSGHGRCIAECPFFNQSCPLSLARRPSQSRLVAARNQYPNLISGWLGRCTVCWNHFAAIFAAVPDFAFLSNSINAEGINGFVIRGSV